MTLYTDSTPMPFGKHIGKKLIDVPADYLIWLYDNNKCNWELKQYIEENMQALRKEAGK